MIRATWKKAWKPLRYFSGWVPDSKARKLTIDFDAITFPVIVFGGSFKLVFDREGYESYVTVPIHPPEFFEKYMQ